jgi:hypothetical protein
MRSTCATTAAGTLTAPSLCETMPPGVSNTWKKCPQLINIAKKNHIFKSPFLIFAEWSSKN